MAASTMKSRKELQLNINSVIVRVDQKPTSLLAVSTEIRKATRAVMRYVAGRHFDSIAPTRAARA